MQRASVDECSEYTAQLCKAEKDAIKQKQDEHRGETGRYLTIPRAIKKIIREWKQLKALSQAQEDAIKVINKF